MNQFNTDDKSFEINHSTLEIQSILGLIAFRCHFSGKSISNITPSKLEKFSSGLKAIWDLDDCTIEFLKCNFDPKLPLVKKVDECFCGVWRIRAKNDISIQFSCYLEEEHYSEFEAYPETGEGLFALSIEKNGSILSIGTEDEEYLINRARYENWLPKHFQSELNVDHLKFLDTGITIEFPKLHQGEKLQAHFIVSSSNKKDNSTWFAVDQSLSEIIQKHFTS
jgi:hypothetical protein